MAAAALAELGEKYAALRAEIGSYRRVSLGRDRAGRAFYVLGESYDALFASPPRAGPGAWLCLPASDLDELDAGLDDPSEAALRATLRRLRPRFSESAGK